MIHPVFQRLVMGLLAGLALVAPRPLWAQAPGGDEPVPAPGAKADADARAAPARDGQAAPAPDGQAPEIRALMAAVVAQREELAAQRAELAAQREELVVQREELAAQRAQAEELAALDADELDISDLSTRDLLSLHGYLDAGWQQYILRGNGIDRAFVSSDKSTFVMGNISLMLDMQPTERWRGFLEFRLTNAPHGQVASLGTPFGAPFVRVNSTVNDSSNPGPLQVIAGNVIIERAWIEWSHRDWLNIRTGLWFTPVGIWNLDHGSPTLISLMLPLVLQFEGFPTRQIGVQVHGRWPQDGWDLGYHAYVSNGRTPGQVDLTHDKMLGGRLFAHAFRKGYEVKLGMSGFYGRYADFDRNVVSYVPFTVDVVQSVGYRESALGLDVSLDRGALRLRSEALVHRVVYEHGLRQPILTPGTFLPDRWQWDGYVLAAYQSSWYGLEPYVYFEFSHRYRGVGDTALLPSLGFNIHFNSAVQLKFQYAKLLYANLVVEEDIPNRNPFDLIASRLVLAF